MQRVRFTALLAVALAAGAAASAGEVAVTLKERDGRAVSDQRMGLRPANADGWGRFARIRATTDATGKVTFTEVPPGSYKVDVGSLEGTDYVHPEENPFAPVPAITLVDDNDRADIVLELWRGVRVVCSIQVDRGTEPWVTVHHHSIEAGRDYVAGTYPLGFTEKVLVPGQWRLQIDSPPGFLLTGLEIDGRPEDGHEAVLTLEAYMPAVHVTWRYSAPATLAGKVTVRGTEDGPLRIRADLVEPGPWIEAARERGGSLFEVVEAGLRRDDTYEMVLPSGRWRVRPQGPRLASSEPPSVDLRLSAGDYRTADFTVSHEPSDGGTLLVKVAGPEGRRVRDAVVEVWSVGADGLPEEALARGTGEPPLGWARFRGLPAGDLLVVAGHVDFIETRLPVDDYDPDEDSPRVVSLTLEAGATIWTRAADERERIVPDVLLEVRRLDDLPPLLLNDPAFVEAKSGRDSRTDATGYAAVSGLYPGLHRVTGRLLGAQAVTRFVRVGRPGVEVAPEIEVGLGPRSELETRLAVLPAASVSGSLACTDGGPFPPGTSIRIFDFDAAGGDPREDPELRDGAGVVLDALPLTGHRQDTFLAGPLENGAYQMALRPTGFGRWTWAMVGERRERAALLHVDKGETSEIGLVSMDCAPAVEFHFTVADGSPTPDLRDAGIVASVVRLADNPERTALEPRVEHQPDSIVLRDLPEGEIEIRLAVEHAYFLPVAEVVQVLETELHRGWLDDQPVVVDGLGGAIQVRGAGDSARLLQPDTPPREQPLERGRALFAAVPPGAYRVELCAEGDCGGARGAWDAVIVHAGRTTFLGE